MVTEQVAHPDANEAPEPAQGSDDYASRIVLEYLARKGYKKAERALVEETMSDADAPDTVENIDDELRDVVLLLGSGSSSSADARRFDDAYCELRDWVDGSLDLYKRELHAVLYPILVHCFLELVRRDASSEARELLARRGAEFRDDIGNAPSRREELTALAGVSSKHHLQGNQTAQMFLKNRYILHLTPFAYELLMAFLTGDSSRVPLLRVLNQRCQVKIDAVPRADSSKQAGFSMDDRPRSAKPVLWGTLTKEHLAASDDSQQRGGEDQPGGETDPVEVKADGTLSAPAVPMPKFREGSQNEKALNALSTDPDALADISPKALPSALLYTVANPNGGHLNAVTVTPDASLVIGAFSDSQIRGWDCTASGTQTFCLTGHSGPVFAVDLSFCRRYVLSCSEDGTARIWTIANSMQTDLVAYRGHNYPVWTCQFAPYGHYFATGGHDRTARVWSTDRVHPLRVLAGHLADVDAVEWHPNCAYLATGSSDRTTRLWDIRTGDCVRVFGAMQGSIHALKFHPNGRLLAMGDYAGNIEVVDVASARVVSRLGKHQGGVWSIDFAKGKDDLLASGGADSTVRIWSTQSATGGSRPAQGVDGYQKPVKVYRSKRTPIQHVQFTRKNLLVCCGAIQDRSRDVR